MTTAHAQERSDGRLVLAWRAFRRWRRVRPFWGGLLLILSGAELFLSSNLELGNLQVHFGPEGYLSYILPAAVALCGLLSWLSPAQRLFYGVLGTLTAVYTLIGLNLGGFFLGMILGLVGGSLAAAWTPRRVAEPPDEAEQAGSDDEVGYRDEAEPLDAEAAWDLDAVLDGDTGRRDQRDADQREIDGPGRPEPATYRYGLLTDSLPHAQRSPLHEDYQAREEYRATEGYQGREGYRPQHSTGGGVPQDTGGGGVPQDTGAWGVPQDTGGAGSADDERPPAGGEPLPRRRHTGALLLAALLLAALAGATSAPQSARAEPCPSPSVRASQSGKASPSGSSVPSGKASPSTAPAPGSSSSPAGSTSAPVAGLNAGEASPSPSPTDEGVIDGVINWFGDLFGGEEESATDPSPSPAPAGSSPTATQSSGPSTGTSAGQSTRPGTGSSTGPSGTASPSRSASTCQPATVAATDAGQPAVAAKHSILLADAMTMNGLRYDGVAELPSKGGASVAALKFVMGSSISTPFELRTPAGSLTRVIKSSKLMVEGDVVVYTTKFSAKLAGIPVTFTPSAPPPPLVPLPRQYTECTMELVFLTSNTLTADGMVQDYVTT